MVKLVPTTIGTFYHHANTKTPGTYSVATNGKPREPITSLRESMVPSNNRGSHASKKSLGLPNAVPNGHVSGRFGDRSVSRSSSVSIKLPEMVTKYERKQLMHAGRLLRWNDAAKGEAATLPSKVEDWSANDVRTWLTANMAEIGVGVADVNRLYRESVNGAALLAYDKETLRDDFKLKLGPITTILKAVREYKTSELHMRPRSLANGLPSPAPLRRAGSVGSLGSRPSSIGQLPKIGVKPPSEPGSPAGSRGIRTADSFSSVGTRSTGDPGRMGNLGSHKPVFDRNKECKVCNRRVRTDYFKQYGHLLQEQRPRMPHIPRSCLKCGTCNVHLCVTSKRNCWNAWHEKEDYWKYN
ncbi:uncharacterized protein LOC144913726 [Branchiostoma floridae x Branchiostoma belcheri]